MVEVIVPATSANLGPGFDVLGLSINLYNRFKLEETEGGLKVEASGDTAFKLPSDEKNLVFASAKRLFDEAGYRYNGLHIIIESRIPLGRGLGSSSTAIVGGLIAANEVSRAGFTKDEIFALATEIEGHPDNVGPAIFGGLTICYRSDPGFRAVTYKPSENLKPVFLIPNNVLETKMARGVLPKEVPLSDAVFNIARASLLVSILLTGRSGLLRDAMQDRLHQPYRASLIPGLADTIREISRATGAGVALSGAGPSLVCIIDRLLEKDFLKNIRQLLKERGQDYLIQLAEFDLEGARVIGR